MQCGSSAAFSSTLNRWLYNDVSATESVRQTIIIICNQIAKAQTHPFRSRVHWLHKNKLKGEGPQRVLPYVFVNFLKNKIWVGTFSEDPDHDKTHFSLKPLLEALVEPLQEKDLWRQHSQLMSIASIYWSSNFVVLIFTITNACSINKCRCEVNYCTYLSFSKWTPHWYQ